MVIATEWGWDDKSVCVQVGEEKAMWAEYWTFWEWTWEILKSRKKLNENCEWWNWAWDWAHIDYWAQWEIERGWNRHLSNRGGWELRNRRGKRKIEWKLMADELEHVVTIIKARALEHSWTYWSCVSEEGESGMRNPLSNWEAKLLWKGKHHSKSHTRVKHSITINKRRLTEMWRGRKYEIIGTE